MKRYIACLVLGATVVGSPSATRGDLIIDLDPITPGIQTALSVTSGSSVTAILYFDPTVSGPLLVNGFGIDLNWTPTGAGSALPVTPVLAGTLAGAPPVELDIAVGTPIGPGAPLTPVGLPPGGGALSLGGVGYVDPTGSFYIGGPIGVVVDLFGVTFTVSGAPGDTITFTPTGILVPGVGATPGAGPFAPGGDPWQASSTSPSVTFPDATSSSVVTIVPEPSATALYLAGLAVFGLLRRSSRAVA